MPAATATAESKLQLLLRYGAGCNKIVRTRDGISLSFATSSAAWEVMSVDVDFTSATTYKKKFSNFVIKLFMQADFCEGHNCRYKKFRTVVFKNVLVPSHN